MHYARRDIAQRIRTTDVVNQLSEEAIARADTDRARALVGLHGPFFYDAWRLDSGSSRVMRNQRASLRRAAVAATSSACEVIHEVGNQTVVTGEQHVVVVALTAVVAGALG